jgi:hypothetical protein
MSTLHALWLPAIASSLDALAVADQIPFDVGWISLGIGLWRDGWTVGTCANTVTADHDDTQVQHPSWLRMPIREVMSGAEPLAAGRRRR